MGVELTRGYTSRSVIVAARLIAAHMASETCIDDRRLAIDGVEYATDALVVSTSTSANLLRALLPACDYVMDLGVEDH